MLIYLHFCLLIYCRFDFFIDCLHFCLLFYCWLCSRQEKFFIQHLSLCIFATAFCLLKMMFLLRLCSFQRGLWLVVLRSRYHAPIVFHFFLPVHSYDFRRLVVFHRYLLHLNYFVWNFRFLIHLLIEEIRRKLQY
jgi:hypothetical protein